MQASDTATRFLHSAGAAIFSQLWRVTVTFGTEFILRRLVPQADFGLFRWAEVVFLVLGGLRDLGLNIHTLRVKPRPFGNLLLVETVWGGTLVALAFLAAPWISLGLKGGHPDVIPVLRAMTLFLFFEGLAIVPLVYFEGELRVRRAVVPELIRNFCYAATAIALALGGHGVWSIVIAQVLASAVFAGALWSRAAGEIPLNFLRGQTLKLLRSSYRLAIIWLLILLVRYVDRFIVGGRFSADVLGVYEFAYQWAFMVPYVMLQPIGRVAYPAFVALAAEKERLFGTYRISTLFLLALEVPAALFLFVNAETVLRIVGGSGQWVGAPYFLRILCLAPLLDPFSRFGGELQAARHRDRLWITATALTLLSFAVGGILLTGLLGPAGMAWANYLPLGGLLMLWGIWQVSPLGTVRLARDLVWVYLLPVPLFAAVWLLGGNDLWLRFGLSFAALALTGGLYAWRFGATFVDFFRGRSPGAEKSAVEEAETEEPG